MKAKSPRTDSKKPARRTPKAAAARGAPAEPSTSLAASKPPVREPRGIRRKRETRARLLDAALRLMAVRGAEGVTISEITEEADVSLGSFYNYFTSKEALHQALQVQVFESFADETQALLAQVEDPAAAVALAIRSVLHRARREPLWGLFLIRESISVQVVERGLGRRLLRDLQGGMALGRFKVKDALMAFTSAGGTVMAAILAQRIAGDDAGAFRSQLQQLGMEGGDIPERTAAAVLTIFGIPSREAEKLARLPMPTTTVTTP